MRRIPFICLLLLSLTASAEEATPWVRIEEIRIDQPGIDDDEYFELRGTPGLSLDRLAYVVLGDGPGDCGSVETVIDLSGLRLDGNGYLCVTSPRSSFRGDAKRVLHFENNDVVTHFLVRDLRAEVGTDLDRDDDGVLDGDGWAETLDSIAFQEGVAPDCVANEMGYSESWIPPDGHFVAGHAYRCDGVWVAGDFELGLTDTPGLPNECDGEIHTASSHR
jgi:hypothetical protein